MMDPPSRKRKLSVNVPNEDSSLASLDVPISPPSRRVRSGSASVSLDQLGPEDQPLMILSSPLSKETPKPTRVIRSPIQLTNIRDLPATANVDAVSLQDLLGDPLISECWNFNYLHDLDFLMAAFDPDVRDFVKVKVIHGFWKREDVSRIGLEVLTNLERHYHN